MKPKVRCTWLTGDLTFPYLEQMVCMKFDEVPFAFNYDVFVTGGAGNDILGADDMCASRCFFFKVKGR